jgi:hypothetical protein
MSNLMLKVCLIIFAVVLALIVLSTIVNYIFLIVLKAIIIFAFIGFIVYVFSSAQNNKD